MMDRIIEPHCVVWVCENGVFHKTRGWRRECEVEVDRRRHMCAGKVLSVQHDEVSAEWKDFCFMLKVVGGGDGNCTSSNAKSFVLDNLQVINLSRRDEREPYRRGIVQDRASECFVCDRECVGVMTPGGARESAEDTERVGGSESNVLRVRAERELGVEGDSQDLRIVCVREG